MKSTVPTTTQGHFGPKVQQAIATFATEASTAFGKLDNTSLKGQLDNYAPSRTNGIDTTNDVTDHLRYHILTRLFALHPSTTPKEKKAYARNRTETQLRDDLSNDFVKLYLSEELRGQVTFEASDDPLFVDKHTVAFSKLLQPAVRDTLGAKLYLQTLNDFRGHVGRRVKASHR